jgi:hypothetical protein
MFSDMTHGCKHSESRDDRGSGKPSDHPTAWIELKDTAQSGSGRKRGIDGEET